MEKYLSAIALVMLCASSAPAQKPELIIQAGHTNEVRGVAFSPDGASLASASVDNSIRIWSVRTGREIRRLSKPSRSTFFLSVAYSPDGALLASGDSSSEVTIWDARTGELLRTLTDPKDDSEFGCVNSVAFAHKKKILASGGCDGGLRIWDVGSGRKLHDLPYTGMEIEAVAFSPDDTMLASGGDRDGSAGPVTLWDVETGSRLRNLPTATRHAQSIAFSKDGKVAAGTVLHQPDKPLGDNEVIVEVWDSQTGRPLASFRPGAQKIITLAFNPAGTLLATGNRPGENLQLNSGLQVSSQDNSISLWDPATGDKVRTLTDRSTPINSLAFSPDGKSLASGTVDTEAPVRILNLSDGSEERVFRSNLVMASAVEFALGGQTLIIGTVGGVSLWDVMEGRLSHQFFNAKEIVTSVSVSGRLLAAASYAVTPAGRGVSGEVKIWDIVTRRLVRALPSGERIVTSVSLSPDGKLLSAARDDNQIGLWEVETGNLKQTYRSTRSEVSGMMPATAFSPDGRLLATRLNEEENLIRVWDVAAGKQLWALDEGDDTSVVLAFDARSKLLAGGSMDGRVRGWDMPSGSLRFTLEDESNEEESFTFVKSVAFSPDGNTLAVGQMHGLVRLWDVSPTAKGDKPRRTLNTRATFVMSVKYTEDGKVLVSSDTEGRIILWDAQTGAERMSLSVLSNGNWFGVTPDGLFDGTPDSLQQVAWRIGNSSEVVPVESFYSNYYHPGLLSEALQHTPPRATLDIATLLQLPGLRAMLAQGKLARLDTKGDVSLLCFKNKPTVTPGTTDDIQNGSFDPSKLVFERTDPTCPWRMVIEDGRSARAPAEGEAERTGLDKPGYDGSKSATSGAALHVLSVGVSSYDEAQSNFKRLPNSAASAKAVESFFLLQAAASEKPYRQIHVERLYDKAATRRAILYALSGVAERAQPEDVVLLFFSGHGVVPIGQEMFYFAPVDARNHTVQDLRESGLNTAMLAEALRTMRARRIVLIIDACQSGGAIDSLTKVAEAKAKVELLRARGADANGTSGQAGQVGIYLLAASTPLEEALQPLNGNSALVGTLLDALGDDCATEGGKIWVKDVMSYVESHLPRNSAAIGTGQTPMVVSFGLDFPIQAKSTAPCKNAAQR